MAPTPMTATRLVLLESLFDTALSLSGELRESFVQESTSHDPALAADLRALLSAHALGDSVFASPVSADRDLSQRWIGARLGAYEVGAQVGAGGMGTVHEAVRADDEYRQRVAVKFLTRGAEGGAAVRRFRAERQFLASLQHPNVATLIDGGVTPDGLPYFVMEYIDGAPITRWCDARSADVKTRLRLFGQVCAAGRAEGLLDSANERILQRGCVANRPPVALKEIGEVAHLVSVRKRAGRHTFQEFGQFLNWPRRCVACKPRQSPERDRPCPHKIRQPREHCPGQLFAGGGSRELEVRRVLRQQPKLSAAVLIQAQQPLVPAAERFLFRLQALAERARERLRLGDLQPCHFDEQVQCREHHGQHASRAQSFVPVRFERADGVG